MRTSKFLLLLFILFSGILFLSQNFQSSIAFSQTNPSPDELNKVSDFVKAGGTMQNVQTLYTINPVQTKNIKNTSQFLQHDLIFSIPPFGNVRTELANSELANKYKNEKVDVFGIPYYYQCYMSDKENSDGACMYGGLTKSVKYLPNDDVITIPVTIDETQPLSFTISYNKNPITIQELDYKVRNFLTKNKNLYTKDGSAFERGYIKFIEDDGNSFWYDLFPNKNLSHFQPSKFLMKYNDNKTVDPSKIKIEVHLFTK